MQNQVKVDIIYYLLKEVYDIYLDNSGDDIVLGLRHVLAILTDEEITNDQKIQEAQEFYLGLIGGGMGSFSDFRVWKYDNDKTYHLNQRLAQIRYLVINLLEKNY